MSFKSQIIAIKDTPHFSLGLSDIPPPGDLYLAQKAELNQSKDTMNGPSQEPEWNSEQIFLDHYSSLKLSLKKRGVKRVSNAWFKAIELYKFVYPGKMPRKIKTFNNAEFPGSFIVALQHFCDERNCILDWTAASLLPDDGNTALEDSYGLYKDFPQKWLMNKDYNGDATKLVNIEYYEKYFGHSVDLYTHDAGVGVGKNFNEQESVNAYVHLGCAICGLVTLTKGGSFIAKQYSVFEPITRDLIYLYATLFDRFYVTKPETSRPYNSETYLIGVGFRGLTISARDIVIGKLQNWNFHPLISNEERSRLKAESDLLKFSRELVDIQITCIKRNLVFYERFKKNRKDALKSRESEINTLVLKWLDTYLPRLSHVGGSWRR